MAKIKKKQGPCSLRNKHSVPYSTYFRRHKVSRLCVVRVRPTLLVVHDEIVVDAVADDRTFTLAARQARARGRARVVRIQQDVVFSATANKQACTVCR